MKVCDKCRKEFNRGEKVHELKVKGMIFDFCSECVEKTINYIQAPIKKGMMGNLISGL